VSASSGAVRNRGVPAAGREVFRLTTPVVVWWIWLAFAAANVLDLAVQGSPTHSAFVIGAIVLLITGFAYVLALRPRVIADQAGITVVNPFRDHHVPWAVIQGVDTGEWVKVRHTRDGSPVTAIDVPGKAIECWALYVSARAKRRDKRGSPPPRSGPIRRFAQPEVDEMARLPAEARYLASLPVAKAIAVRLDARAAKERARAGQAGSGQAGSGEHRSGQDISGQAGSGQDGSGPPQRPSPVTARWAWFPLAAIAAPALLLLIALLI
jgi:Bacterial PH domain